jgi:glycosyltransferase involved in cell wall biosynthesis
MNRRIRRPRVLIVAPSLDMLGGQAIQAARLLGRLRGENGVEVGFLPVNPRLPGPLALLQRIKYVRTLVTSLWYGAGLLLRVPRYDLLHVFSASYWSFVLAPTPAIFVGRLYGKKVIVNYHSGEAADHLARWHTAVPTLRLAHALVAPSGYLVDVFARFGLLARPIFNIVDIDRFRFRERHTLRPTFLSNRSLEPMYNVACVLRAFALIQRRFPDATLTVAGDGSQRAKLESLARTLGLRAVSFVGSVPNTRMHELCDAADIYLNGSDVDNMPGSIIEAFAAGLPVVTTDAGGIPYIVAHERTGLLVPRNDSEAMAAAAARLIEHPGFAASLTAQARAECERYAWDAVRGDWLTLYRFLAGLASPEPR